MLHADDMAGRGREIRRYRRALFACQALVAASVATLAASVNPGYGHTVFGAVALTELGRTVTPYPGVFILEQSRNEQILYANLRELGADVRWGAPVTDLRTAHGGVEATVGGDTVRARFCVGCDGGGC